MKKNLQEKDSQLQSELKIGDKVISLVSTTHLQERHSYTIDYIQVLNDGTFIIGFAENSGFYGYHPLYFRLCTELNKALL